MSDKLISSALSGEGDPSLLFESASDLDDLVLGVLDVGEFDGPHDLELLLDHLRGTGRDGLEHLLAHGGARGLEREGEDVVADLLHDALHASVVDILKILEDEHELSDVLGESGIDLFDLSDDLPLGGLVEGVEDLGDGLDAADSLVSSGSYP